MKTILYRKSTADTFFNKIKMMKKVCLERIRTRDFLLLLLFKWGQAILKFSVSFPTEKDVFKMATAAVNARSEIYLAKNMVN